MTYRQRRKARLARQSRVDTAVYALALSVTLPIAALAAFAIGFTFGSM